MNAKPSHPTAAHSHHGMNRCQFFRVTTTAGTGLALARMPVAGALIPAAPSLSHRDRIAE